MSKKQKTEENTLMKKRVRLKVWAPRGLVGEAKIFTTQCVPRARERIITSD